MDAFAAAGAAFLVAVLWFDLMFDVQLRGQGGETLPEDVLASIAAYYRRVTTLARPMNRLIPLVMLATVAAIVVQIVRGVGPWWISWPSLGLAAAGIGLAMARTVRNAVRLGARTDPADVQTRLARSVYRDHLFCLAAMSLAAGLQLAGSI